MASVQANISTPGLVRGRASTLKTMSAEVKAQDARGWLAASGNPARLLAGSLLVQTTISISLSLSPLPLLKATRPRTHVHSAADQSPTSDIVMSGSQTESEDGVDPFLVACVSEPPPPASPAEHDRLMTMEPATPCAANSTGRSSSSRRCQRAARSRARTRRSSRSTQPTSKVRPSGRRPLRGRLLAS